MALRKGEKAAAIAYEIKDCGYIVKTPPYTRGRMTELLAHYKRCQHSACKIRHQLATDLGKKLADYFRRAKE